MNTVSLFEFYRSNNVYSGPYFYQWGHINGVTYQWGQTRLVFNLYCLDLRSPPFKVGAPLRSTYQWVTTYQWGQTRLVFNLYCLDLRSPPFKVGAPLRSRRLSTLFLNAVLPKIQDLWVS